MLLIQHDTYTKVIDLTKHVLQQVKAKGWKGMLATFIHRLKHR